MRKKKGFFSISAVAKMFSVHQQTIRLYEKEGLLNPKRTEGNTRIFSEEDVDRLEEIIHLTHKLGINIAGVQMILKLQKQLKKMQKETNAIFEAAQDELKKDVVVNEKMIKETTINLASLQKKSLPKNNSGKEIKNADILIEYDEE
jgi:MerR family transcriptional regulator/heat shock protein HspR